MATVSKVQLLLEERSGRLRSAAKLAFTRRDASIYVVPYARQGEYFYGRRAMAAGQAHDSFDFREQEVSASARPKLSIHEQGRVHIYARDVAIAGPLQIPALTELRGEHVATVHWDSTESLPEHRGKTKTTGAEIDCAFGVPDDVQAGALLFFANGSENLFRTGHVHFAIPVASRVGTPVFLGITAVAKDPSTEGGVSVLAGFDPTKTEGEPDEYLYLRGL